MNKNCFISLAIKLMLISAAAMAMSGCTPNDPALEQLDGFISKQQIDKTNPQWKQNLSKPPQLVFAEGTRYLWLLETTQGNLTIELMSDTAPMHVSSTIYLTQLGFYDDIIFHRVIPGFMAQGGDPKGLGSGGPGYQYAGEFGGASHDKPGILSMANSGPNTDGSQFFLTFKPTPFLDGRHTVFGEVINGLDVLEKLASLGSRSGKTSEEIKIIKAEIVVQS
ncbi:MAG: peptidylprolyl isomerase [Gammaproteobacteria bacterium]|nr:peptidylprolyl isomerase [Gammaproteobacteria bacterium]